MEQVASILRGTRRSAGVSQRHLAKVAHTSQAAIARYETGRVVPSIETLERLFDALGVRLELRAVPRLSGPRGRVLEQHRGEILEICRRHGALSPRVFGSVARGEDRPDSDIDLLVEMEAGRTLLDLERLQIELSERLSVPVDVGTEQMLKEGISEAVHADLIAL